MKNTGILCPDCFNGMLLTPEDDTDNYAVCPKCNTDFTITGHNTVVYGGTMKSSPEPSEPTIKKFQVTMYDGEDKFWVFAYGANAKEAMKSAEDSISAINATEFKED